jgi:hypothetical protein
VEFRWTEQRAVGRAQRLDDYPRSSSLYGVISREHMFADGRLCEFSFSTLMSPCSTKTDLDKINAWNMVDA